VVRERFAVERLGALPVGFIREQRVGFDDAEIGFEDLARCKHADRPIQDEQEHGDAKGSRGAHAHAASNVDPSNSCPQS
jgi:hypothetical protein